MLLGFKPQFEPKILIGLKIHTIRDDDKGRWQAGKKMHMATGTRTKNCKIFRVTICKGYQWIKIYKKKVAVTMTENQIWFYDLKPDQLLQLALQDGFDSVEDFFAWWNSKPRRKRKLIHWTEFRYPDMDLPF